MMEPNEARLIEKLRAIEALYARPGSEGERVAAENARERILERLRQSAEADPPVEYRFTMADMWSRRVFVALLRRYGISPYRYRRQRYTTVMAKVSRRFVDETLWPEFEALSSSLRSYLEQVTNRVVAEVIHADVSEATVMQEPQQLAAEAAPAEASAEAPPEREPGDAAASARRRKKNAKKRKKRKKR